MRGISHNINNDRIINTFMNGTTNSISLSAPAKIIPSSLPVYEARRKPHAVCLRDDLVSPDKTDPVSGEAI